MKPRALWLHELLVSKKAAKHGKSMKAKRAAFKRELKREQRLYQGISN